MNDDPRTETGRSGRLARTVDGSTAVLGLGVGFLLLHVRHAADSGGSLRTFLWGILIPMVISLGLIVAGIRLRRGGFDPPRTRRIAAAAGIGAAVIGLTTVPLILYQRAEGVIMSDRLYVVANASTVGGAIGFVVGMCDAWRAIAQARADVTQSRAELMSRRLSVLNRVLRHDIRNRANIIKGHAGLAAGDNETGSNRLETVREEADELVEMSRKAREIEQLIGEEPDDLTVVDASAVTERAARRVQQDHPAADVETLGLGDPARVRAHPRLEKAVTNVVENAVEHNDGSTPRVAAGVVDRTDGRVELLVRDDGPGMPEMEVAVLERGYETPLEHASGLGLWLTNWIVTEAGGEIAFEENDCGGSDVRIRLDAAPAD